jgi:hypothetical protein
VTRPQQNAKNRALGHRSPRSKGQWAGASYRFHGLTGQNGTMAAETDMQQDTDLRIYIELHSPDVRH